MLLWISDGWSSVGRRHWDRSGKAEAVWDQLREMPGMCWTREVQKRDCDNGFVLEQGLNIKLKGTFSNRMFLMHKGSERDNADLGSWGTQERGIMLKSNMSRCGKWRFKNKPQWLLHCTNLIRHSEKYWIYFYKLKVTLLALWMDSLLTVPLKGIRVMTNS